jgi:hypothetical protein
MKIKKNVLIPLISLVMGTFFVHAQYGRAAGLYDMFDVLGLK